MNSKILFVNASTGDIQLISTTTYSQKYNEMVTAGYTPTYVIKGWHVRLGAQIDSLI